MNGALSIGLYKEARALGTTWALAAVALIAMSWWGKQPAFQMGIAAYIAGAVFLGAESIGQEYAHRTLPVLLSQPMDRRRVYLQKLAVLIVMLLTLAAIQWAVRGDEWRQLAADRSIALWLLPIVGGAFIAPWFTMVSRSSLGGASLTCFTAGMTWIALLLIPIIRFGSGVDEAGAIALGYTPRVIVGFSAIAAVLGWRKFITLEAIDGEVGVIRMPRWIAASEGRRHYRPWRALISKELHLQQLTFAITIQYFTVWALLGWLLRLMPAWRDFPFAVVTTVYCMILPLAIGAIASADERQRGMHDWQRLQPLAAWQQWIVKTGVVLALSLTLGVGLPLLLGVITSDAAAIRMGNLMVMVSIFMTAAGLYLSSLSTSAVRALVAALPAGAVVLLLMQAVFKVAQPNEALPTVLSTGLFFGIVSLVLIGLAYVNHNSTERRWSSILAQALSLGVVVVIALMAAT